MTQKKPLSKGRGIAGGVRFVGIALVLLLKLAATLLMIAVPLLGVWVSSSLAVFKNGGLPWAILIGLVMFPVAPMAWDIASNYRRRKKGKHGPRIFTWFDRLVIRTVFLNVVFLAGLLALYPRIGFMALSTRGDWMLEGQSGPNVTTARRLLHQAADTLEWLYRLATKNPYDHGEDDRGKQPRPRPHRDDGRKPSVPGVKTGTSATGTSGSATKAPASPTWPEPARLHPAVTSISAATESSWQSVADYLKAKTGSERDLARAIHDYIADRVAYDAPALAAKRYPPYDPETVFKRRSAVCAGYAKLFEAMAKRAGLHAVYVPGHARDRNGDVDGVGHAWSAVQIDGSWELLDVTWDAGHVKGDTFVKDFTTTYFATPPEIFSSDHFPEKPQWQLRQKPLTRGEFIRQPMMRPEFYAAGLRLISPRRSQVTVDRTVVVTLDNRRGQFVMAGLTPLGAFSPFDRCKVSSDSAAARSVRPPTPQARITCTLPASSSRALQICVSTTRYGKYHCVGKIQVHSS